MARAQRPRIEKAVKRDVESDAIVEASRQAIIENLPAITDKIIKLGLDGNTAMLGKLLDFLRDTAQDAEAQRSNILLDKIAALRTSAVEQVNDGASGHPPDLGTASGDGTVDPDASGKEGSLVGAVSPPSADQ